MKIGDKIPEMLGVDANGKEVKASDYAGKRLAIYFYPKDNTPGCTAEACSLRDGYDALRSAGYEVIGVSKDSAASHGKFAAKHSLPFTLIADTDTTLNQAFGVWQKRNGRTGVYGYGAHHVSCRRRRHRDRHHCKSRHQKQCLADS